MKLVEHKFLLSIRFIVNKGDATSKDVEQLIKYIQEVVYEKFQVKLETEIEFIGGKE